MIDFSDSKWRSAILKASASGSVMVGRIIVKRIVTKQKIICLFTVAAGSRVHCALWRSNC